MGFLGAIVSLLAFLLCVGCTSPDGSMSAEHQPNTYEVAGQSGSFASVVAETNVDGNIMVAASPRAGLKSVNSVMEADEYLFIAISPLLHGETIDLCTETIAYTVISTLRNAPIQCVAVGDTKELRAGAACVCYDDMQGVLRATLDASLASGVTLTAKMEAKCTLDIITSSMSRGSEVKPVRAAFYDTTTEGVTTLYLSPGGVDYASQLTDVSFYMALRIDNSQLSGEVRDIQSVGVDSAFAFGVVDNWYTSKSVAISATDMKGASGTFAVQQLGDKEYSLALEITINNVCYAASFSGECVSVEEAPVVDDANRITYAGVRSALCSATLTKGSPWRVMLDVEDGSQVVITAPDNFFDGSAKGFSQSADFTVSYDGRTYSKANGDSGTMTALYDESQGVLAVEFSNYNNLDIYYSGVVLVE